MSQDRINHGAPDGSMDRPRILIARPDHLGDVLLTLPAVARLRCALPNAHISYLVPEAVAAVPRHCPAVDATLTLPFPPIARPFDPAAWERVVAPACPAFRGRFDLAILPRLDDPWSGTLVAAAGVPLRLGYAHPRTHPFLTTALPLPDRRHVASLAHALVQAAVQLLGGVEDESQAQTWPWFVPTVADQAEVDTVLAELAPTAGATPIILHPGSGWTVKNWPPARWGALAAALRQSYGLAPLITGSPGEQALVQAVVAASGGQAHGLAGRLSLGGLAALYVRTRLVIATDSGPLHLAAALGTPVVGLYGPAATEEFGPQCWPAPYRIVRSSLPCSPCRVLEAPPCGVHVAPACMQAVTVAAVLGAADDLLAANSSTLTHQPRQWSCHAAR